MDRFCPHWLRIFAGLGAHHEEDLLGEPSPGQPRLSPRGLVIVSRLYDLKNPAIRVDEARDAVRHRRPSPARLGTLVENATATIGSTCSLARSRRRQILA